MKKTSIVINARIGSTRIKNKLCRRFGNSSLIEIALNKLNKLEMFEHRFLAAYEKDLLNLTDKYSNVEKLVRESDAVKPGVNPPEITFKHYEKIPSDYIFILNPCLPFISIKTIINAYNYFLKSNYLSYTAAIETRDWIFDEKGNAITNSNPNNLTTNKGIKFYKAAHAFHIINKTRYKRIKRHWDFNIDDPHLVSIPKEEAIDIDEEVDFQYAEYIYNKK